MATVRMRSHVLWPSLLLGLGSTLAPANAQSARATLDAPLEATTAVQIVDDIDRALRQHFAHWTSLASADYERAFATYRADALAAPDRRRFSLLSEAFVAHLNNGHTQFNDPALYAADPGNLGFTLRHVDGHWVVTSSRRPALEPGAVVTALDAEPFEAFYARVRGQLNASSERTRRSGLTAYAALFPLSFTLHLLGGDSITVDRTQSLSAAHVAMPGFEHAWLRPDSVLFVRLRSFADPRTESQAIDALQHLRDAAVRLIIDVRGNGGGTTPSRLGRLLLKDQWRSWRTSPPATPKPALARTPPPAPRMFVLVDRGCGSACEDFVMPFSLSDTALVIGEATGGSSGQPRIVRWSNGMNLWVGARRLWFPDGREFEGLGITPDVLMPAVPGDFRIGAPDRVLICARQLATTGEASECR